MDAKLEQTLDKIMQLCSKNAEFGTELQKRLGKVHLSSISPDKETKIDKIEKYLGLDFAIDTMKPNIDYSYIKADDVRNQLESDFREMMRFRYGTRSHKTDFGEYCKYAHLQIEMLINYYYESINKSNLESIKKHIKKHNPKVKGLEDAKSITEIAYASKKWAFCNEFLKKDSTRNNNIGNIHTLRNELSHRSMKDEEENDSKISNYKKHLENLGFKLNINGSLQINWKDPNEDIDLKKKYEDKLNNNKEYKQYLYLIWLKSEPYDSIIDTLRKVSTEISKKIITI